MTEQNTEQPMTSGDDSGNPTGSSRAFQNPVSQDDYDRIQTLAQGGAEWVDVPTIAALMGVSTWTIYRALKRKEIPHVHVGRQVRINRHAFDEAMRRRTEGALEDED